jgi:hypothetical protein
MYIYHVTHLPLYEMQGFLGRVPSWNSLLGNFSFYTLINKIMNQNYAEFLICLRFLVLYYCKITINKQ